MNPRTTGILLLVALAFGAYIYVVEIQGDDSRAEAEAQEKRLFHDVAVEEIDWIELLTPDGGVRLERQNADWRIVAPIDFPADSVGAEALATSLSELAREETLEGTGDAEEYGLAESARIVRFGVGEAHHSVRFGRDTPIGPNAYAQVEGDAAIVTVPRFRANSFDKTLATLRDRRILEFDTASVERLEVRWQGGAVTLEKQVQEEGAAAEWRVTSPIAARADEETVRELVDTLSFLQATGFVDTPDAEALASFEAPNVAVTLYLSGEDGGEARTLEFALGAVHEGDQRLVQAGEAALYTIGAERAVDFPRKVVDYRFREVSRFAIGDARQVDLYFQSPSGDPVAISATRGDSGWSSTPEPTAPGKVARLVSELSNLKASDIVLEDAAEGRLGELGLAPPRVIVTVLGDPPDDDAEGTPRRLAEVHLGEAEGSEWIMARAIGNPALYRLDYALAEYVPVSLDAFRNRFAAEDEPDLGDPEGEPDVLTPSEESP